MRSVSSYHRPCSQLAYCTFAIL